MRYTILPIIAAAALSASAMAQTAVPIPAAPQTNPAAPVSGANSFTEAQAKERLEKAGFTTVIALTKDSNGVWRGKATKGAAAVDVSLDYQGNIVSN